MSLQIFDVRYVSPLSDIEPENDNIDVHVHLSDGRVYSFLVATPNNIYKCMDNEGIEYFFGIPPLFVKVLDRPHIEEVVRALLSENNGKWLAVYGVLQTTTS
jgi:hypothetical protein